MGLPVEVNPLFLKNQYAIQRSLRFRASASASLTRTPASATNRKTWTYSCWVKRGLLNSSGEILAAGTGTTLTQCFFVGSGFDRLQINVTQSGTQRIIAYTNSVFRDPSSWYHVVYAIDTTQATNSNGVRIYVNGVLQALTFSVYTQNVDTEINNNVIQYIGQVVSVEYFDGYLAETNFVDGYPTIGGTTYNATTWAALNVATIFGQYNEFGVWSPRKYGGSYGTNGFYLPFTNTGNGQNILTYSQDFTNAVWLRTTGVTATGDTVAAPNGTTTADTITYAGGGTAGNYRIYYTSAGVSANGTVYTYSIWLRAASNVNLKLSGNFGSDVDITVTSTWQRFSLTVTGNGSSILQLLLYSPVGDNSAFTVYAWGAQLEIASTPGPYFPTTSAPQSQVNLLGADYSLWPSYGYNSWVPSNISTTAGTTYDAMTDVPPPSTIQNVAAGNYATLNPLWTGTAIGTFTNGNLTYTQASGANTSAIATFGVSSGKWYFETTLTTLQAGSDPLIGMITPSAQTSTNAYPGQLSSSYSAYNLTSNAFLQKVNNGTFTNTNQTIAVAGNIISVAVDMDNGRIWFGKNGTWCDSGDPAAGANAQFTGLTGTLAPAFRGAGSAGLNCSLDANFGQRPFSYTPPSGFLPLNSNNLPTPTIPNGARFMAAVTYQGATAPNTVTTSSTNSGNNPLGTTFQPDLVWIKSRSAATDNKVTDALRGVTKAWITNSSNAPTIDTNGLTAFTTSGFTVGSDTTYNNTTGPATYVAWQWLAGNVASPGNLNTNGSLNSYVSVNASAGFSIVSATAGASGISTVGHGLGVAPSFLIVKPVGATASSTQVFVSGVTSINQFLALTDTRALATSANIWGSSLPDSNVFGFTNGNTVVASQAFIAYCWTPIAGYSAFNRYTGNGSADGTFVYTGFRPRWVLIKRTDVADQWVLFDSSRGTYNLNTPHLLPNSANAEANAPPYGMDFLSNGFKCRDAGTSMNANGGTYIYAAFAENPFKLALAR